MVIVTERDYARKIVLLDRSSRATRVSDVVTAAVLCVSPERALEECMALMTETRVRHLPVLRDDELMGVPPSDAWTISKIIGERTIVTEVVAYRDLAAVLEGNLLQHPRSAVIASLCIMRVCSSCIDGYFCRGCLCIGS